ncbi:MAG: hypothetical protein HY363_05455 [Candidatus Aenigmarchaeota archaeon]|nr:hypothetical protein [Candidatus Aenigmarchaeota archaeon]
MDEIVPFESREIWNMKGKELYLVVYTGSRIERDSVEHKTSYVGLIGELVSPLKQGSIQYYHFGELEKLIDAQTQLPLYKMFQKKNEETSFIFTPYEIEFPQHNRSTVMKGIAMQYCLAMNKIASRSYTVVLSFISLPKKVLKRVIIPMKTKEQKRIKKSRK